MKKFLALGVIFLFIGVAIAPSINFTVVKASNDDDLVEVTSQACGINGFGNQTVKLTRQQYQDFQYLSDNETPRHPKLLAFVVLILWLRFGRGDWLMDHSVVWIREQHYITHPLLYLRGLWLIWRATGWASRWMFLATVFGWNWGFEDFFNPSQSKE